MEQLQKDIIQFTKARNWNGNNDARNLAISISLEASELLEHFQWQSAENALATNKQEIAEEAADARKKIEKNAERFPFK